MPKSLRIISRNSILALCQSEYVKDKLNQLYPDISITIIGVTTLGDKVLDRSLDKIGGKGLFTKELEVALLNGTADLAVHSAKDMSSTLNGEFTIAAILEREASEDAFVSNNFNNIDELPHGAIIGTSSARRVALLNKYYPDYTIKLLRGNVHTRLKKLDAGEYDGIILAVAGLNRLGLNARIKQYLNKNKFVPAIGQGALAIEIISSNQKLLNLIKPLNHDNTNIAVMAEREVGKILKASCSIPIAAHADINEKTISLQAYIADKETGECCEFSGTAPIHSSLTLAKNCANALINQGALDILQRYR